MKLNKTILCYVLIPAFAFSVVGCQNNAPQEEQKVDTVIPVVTDELKILDGVKFDYDKTFDQNYKLVLIIIISRDQFINI